MTENNNLSQVWGNDEKRKAFLADYEKWGVWITTKELDLAYYRYLLPNGTAIIAEKHKQRKYVGYKQGYQWETGASYYVIKPDEPFSPESRSCISAVADLLKEAKSKMQADSRTSIKEKG